MNDAVVSVLVVALVICTLPGTALAGAGTPTASEDVRSASIQGSLAATDDAKNETARHQNPDEYEGDGDDEQLESWLSNRLSSQLEGSTIALSEGEYDRAREYVDEDYHDRLSQYVEVAGETESTGDEDETNETEAYEQAAAEQERMANNVEEYRETRDEYETALEEGDDERARELGRELEEQYQEIDEASQNAITSYETITSETDANLSESATAVEEVRADIEEEQTTVREEQFVETEFHFEADNDTISFSEPLVGQGEIRTADGSTIESDGIQLRVNGNPITVDSGPGNWWSEDAGAGFELEYRPTALDLESETVTVEYVPDSESAYLGSETEVDVTVEQDEPTITNLGVSSEVAYRETLWVGGELAVDGVPVDDVPLVVTVGDEPVGTVNTTNGTFEGTTEVPANVSDGEQPVEVVLPFEDQALAATSAEASVTVVETETELTLEATAVGEDELAIEGQLETADGEGLEEQPIQIQIGSATETVTTGADGEFADTVSVDSDNDEVTVGATYEGADTNLATATAETTVPMPGGGNGLLDAVASSALPVFGALLVVGTLAAIAWWRRRNDDQSPQDSAVPVTSTDGSRTSEPETPSRAVVDALVERAADQLANGRADAAVRSCYAAVRYAHGAALGGGGALTHWEFYREHTPTHDRGEDRDHLRELIEAYERAAFTPDATSESAAQRILKRTRTLCKTDDGSETPSRVSSQPSDD